MVYNQTIKDRLIFFIKSLGIGQGKFEKACGLSNGWVNNIKATIMPDKLQKISLQYPNLNTAWLMTGEGSMLRVMATASSFEEAEMDASPLVQELRKQIALMQEEIDKTKTEINDKDRLINVLTKALDDAQKDK